MTYYPGKFWQICDICGFKHYNTDMKKTWDKLVVCPECFDGPRNPQDYLVKPKMDRLAVSDPRPEPEVVYVSETEDEENVATNVSNTDIDTGTETIDSFADTDGVSVVWDYAINDGTNYRSGTIMATWDETADSTPAYTETRTKDIGDTSGVSFAVDKNSNTVRLRCTVTSDDWSCKAIRHLVGE